MHATPDPSRRAPLIAAVLVVVVVVGVIGVALLIPDRKEPGRPLASAAPTAAVTTTPALPPAPTPSRTEDCGQWGCAVQHRLDAATRLVATAPGKLGVTVLDRRSGAVWEAGTASHSMWASSTPKLAIATSLLERERSGEITLDATARRQLAAMLAVSDDDAADALWDRYGGASLLPRFRDRYGMTGAHFVAGFPQRWGFIKISAPDLRRLMTYVLTRTDPADRAYLVNAMRTTGPIQHWGVWAAGVGAGAKDGWSIEKDAGTEHWCTSSVGFAGPGERYVVAVMDDLPPGAGIGPGVHATSDVVATLFGAHTPAAVTVPDESTGR